MIRFYRARRVDNIEWVRGYLWQDSSCAYIIPYNLGVSIDNNRLSASVKEVIPETICEETGVEDKNHTMLITGDLVETNFVNGEKFIAEVTFKDGAYGLKWTHNDGEHYSAFTSFTDSVWFNRVGNIHDELDEKYYKMCGSDAMAIDILKFIQNNYQKRVNDQPGCQKYIDALQIGIDKISAELKEEAEHD